MYVSVDQTTHKGLDKKSRLEEAIGNSIADSRLDVLNVIQLPAFLSVV